MKKAFRAYFILSVIVILAFFIRVYNVSANPPALSWDEVSIGYNAYSILKTGRDEHQQFLPITAFTAYGDYKPPLAIYLTIPSVALFGLNEFAVRLPSVIFGTLTVLVLFFLVRELLPRVPNVALISSLVLAFSPWHINLSRAGFEANIALFFVVLGTYLVLLTRKNKTVSVICWLPFIAAIYTFNSARYFSVFWIAGLLFYCHKSFLKNRKEFIAGIILSLILLSPMVPFLLSKEARLRFNEVNIFTDSSIVRTSNERLSFDENAWWAKILDNRRIGYTRSFLVHFFDNLEPGFLFVHGDGNPKFSIQEVGQMYVLDLPFLIMGIYLIFSSEASVGWLLLYWLIVAIIPAATARETPHALRIENGLPVFLIFLSAGLAGFYERYISKRIGKILIGIVLLLYIGNILFYFHNYYIHYPRIYSGEWEYGYKQAIDFVKPIQNNYDKIFLTDSIGRPYMYVLFYEKVDPQLFWRTVNGSFDAAGFYNVYGFGKFNFVRGEVISFDRYALYILDSQNVPKDAHVLKTIDFLNGDPALTVFEMP